MNEWQESGAITEQIILRFTGINQDEKDQLDLENFARGLKAPSKEDPGGKAFAVSSRSRAMSPMDVVRLGLGLAFAYLGSQILPWVGLPETAVVIACVALLILGALSPSIVFALRGQQAKPVVRVTKDAFTLLVSPAGLALEGQALPRQSYELASIDRVDGAARLAIHRRDGTTVTLPCCLPGRAHQALAARLNELLAEARAREGGTRGG